MAIVSTFREGVGRVNRAPSLLVGVFVGTLLMALPMALSLRAALRDHLGASLASESLAQGVNYDWWQEFSAEAKGATTTFRPTIIGFGAVLENLSAMVDNRPQTVSLTATAALYLFLWIFLIGGILDRYARPVSVGHGAFFAACGTFLVRFLRLGVLAFLCYFVLFRYVHPFLFKWIFVQSTKDVTVEREAFLIRLLLYLVFGAMLAAVNLIFDYAKIRTVVEDRRSMLAAVPAAWRFVSAHRRSAIGLYMLNGGVFALVLALYAVIAPGIGGAGLSVWVGLLVSQAYLLARLWVKLVFYASQTALFQGAFADRVRTAVPVWPESPPAEISNA